MHPIQVRVFGVTLIDWLGALLSVQAVVHCGPLSTCDLVVHFARYATMKSLSFSVVGPITWNGHPIDLSHLTNGACSQFCQLLKTVLLLVWTGSAS